MVSPCTEFDAELDALIGLPDLDAAIRLDPSLTRKFDGYVDDALAAAFASRGGDAESQQFLHRTLYRINRMTLFWFDALSNYDNERSAYLAGLRERIERPWQEWEALLLPIELLSGTKDIERALRSRAGTDVVPHETPRGTFYAEGMQEAGYRRLLEIFSLDALVEASQLSRTIAGVGGHIHSYVTRLLLEEYGGGRPHHKHSAYFEVMLKHLGMDATPEAYFERVPWEVLANINHSFLMAERKKNYLRYMGGLLYTETSTPVPFANYARAAERLGLPEDAYGYWTIHVKADKVHGRWMMEEIALPLAEKYPREAWQLVLGYDQQSFIADRASAAVERAVMAADQASPVRTLFVPAAA